MAAVVVASTHPVEGVEVSEADSAPLNPDGRLHAVHHLPAHIRTIVVSLLRAAAVHTTPPVITAEEEVEVAVAVEGVSNLTVVQKSAVLRVPVRVHVPDTLLHVPDRGVNRLPAIR